VRANTLITLIRSIRDVGIRDQTFQEVRRVRTINVAACLTSAITFSYCLLYIAYDWWHFRVEIAFLLVFSSLYPTTLLLTRANRPTLAMWLLVNLAVTHLATITWLLGPASGALNYLMITPFVLSLIIKEGDRYSVWPIAVAVSVLMIVITLTDDLGSVDTLPETFRLVLFVINVSGAVLFASGMGLFFRWLIQKAETQLENERRRSDRLLHAILPAPVAEQLKQDESQQIASRVPAATVLFADIVGFTKRSAETGPDRMVAELNRVFGRIDDLADRHGVEKIKTIGDAYFAVGGVPEPCPDHAARIAAFALDIRELAQDWQSEIWPSLSFRIAIHSGPVVAGVIGRSKFAYDVWGTTVNSVARLEEECDPGEIWLTDATASLLPPDFVLEPVGPRDLRDSGTRTIFRLAARTRD